MWQGASSTRLARYADPAAAVALAAFSLAESRVTGRFPGPIWADLAVALLAALPLAWRRRSPLGVLASVLVVDVAYAAVWSLPQSAGGLLVLVVAVYSLARHEAGRKRYVAVAPLAVALGFLEWRDPTTGSVAEAAPTFALVAAAYVAGLLARRGAERTRQMAELAARLQAEQEETARLAVMAERLHIARELHDLLAHSVSVMVVQVGAARLVGHLRSPEADAALRTAEDVGRGSLADLRRLLTVLRDDPEQQLLPQPRVAALPALLASSAPHVDFQVDPSLPELPAGLDLVVYRIVQEATTNLVKHAPGAAASVRISHTDGGIHVVVDNGPAAELPSATTAGSGHGLVGMAERAALYGGHVVAEPRPDGGFRVHAVLTLETVRSATEFATS